MREYRLKGYRLQHRVIASMTLCFLSLALCGYKVKCNKEQTECEVDSRRLAPGDRVAIFDEDRYLVALGTVSGLKGKLRQIKVDKHFAVVMADHELELITDEQYANPQEFKTSHALPRETIGLSGGMISIGVGEGFLGVDAEGYYERMLRGNLLVVGRGFFLHGSGEASITRAQIESLTFTLSAVGLMGGVSYQLLPGRDLSFRGELGLGVAHVSAEAAKGVDAADTADGRVAPGPGLALRAEVAALFRIGKLRPFASTSIFRLQKSVNFSAAAGLAFPI